MANYTYKSWQTINLSNVSTDTYYRILDHQASGNPSLEVTGVIYDGVILSGYHIQNLQEILGQYVKPTPIQFNTPTLQPDDSAIHKFYIYYSTNGWVSYTNDTVTIIYDWGYEISYRTKLSDPIINIIDSRQWFLFTMRRTAPSSPQTLTVYVNDIQIDSFDISGYNPYNYVRDLSNNFPWPGEFDLSYSYDYLITRSSMKEGTYSKLTIYGSEYLVVQTCYKYCLYYLNQYGGWDSLLFRGRELETDNISRLSYKKNYVAQDLNFHKVDYLSTINETWQLNTSFLEDAQSEKMINLMASNVIYLHDLTNNKIIPVNITNKKCEHKTYKNQRRKLYSYVIEVSASQPKYRI